MIKPEKELENNKLYKFIMKQELGNDITWAFQTCTNFKVESSFPQNKETSVPTNTGIEIYFSHTDFDDIDSYFNIMPKAKGKLRNMPI